MPSEIDTLQAVQVGVVYRGLVALEDVSIELERGEIQGLIGPNGAGKTTLVNVISGYALSDTGEVRLGERAITKLGPARRASLGVVRTFQGGRLFSLLTVAENLEVAAISVGVRRREARRRAADLMRRLGLEARADVPAGALPYGEERKVALGRAAATTPSFLLIDEPAAGLDERETDELAEMIAELRAETGCGVLVIEHDMSFIMGLCDRIHVLAKGRTLAVGTPAQVRADADVQAAYLGTAGGHA